jgi:hypothetical protein
LEFVDAKYIKEKFRTGCCRHKKEVCQGLVLAKIPNWDLSLEWQLQKCVKDWDNCI